MLGLVAAALGTAAIGCQRQPPRSAEHVPARPAQSTLRERTSVAVTVYNGNFGLVRERRALPLGEGRVELSYQDVAARLQPETVHIRSLTNAAALTILEQNYRYDLLTPETLLNKYVGKTLRVVMYNEHLGREEEKTAEVLATEQGAVFRIDGEISYGLPGRLSFPKLPKELVTKPTLVWLLDSAKPKHEIEVTYITEGLRWAADYVMMLDKSEQHADLTGWVSLDNDSGASFENAELKLVAGDVHRTPAPDALRHQFYGALDAPKPQLEQQSLFEYHLYSLGRTTTLRDKEKKQVRLLEARGVPVAKKLVLEGSDTYFRPVEHAPLENQKVRAELQWSNDAKSQLGAPLPKGVVRVYQQDQDDNRQFVGEDRIDHTPRDEKVTIKLGEAFDVVGNRKELQTTALNPCLVESEWSVELRNHKDTAVVVEVREHTAGSYELLHSSLPAQRKDARTFSFSVPVQARGKTAILYRVRVRYCPDATPPPAVRSNQ